MDPTFDLVNVSIYIFLICCDPYRPLKIIFYKNKSTSKQCLHTHDDDVIVVDSFFPSSFTLNLPIEACFGPINLNCYTNKNELNNWGPHQV